MSKYKIAEIAVELKEDGEYMFWCYNHGFHPSQGGMEFCYGNSEQLTWKRLWIF